MCRYTQKYLGRLFTLSMHAPEGYSTCLCVCLSVYSETSLKGLSELRTQYEKPPY